VSAARRLVSLGVNFPPSASLSLPWFPPALCAVVFGLPSLVATSSFFGCGLRWMMILVVLGVKLIRSLPIFVKYDLLEIFFLGSLFRALSAVVLVLHAVLAAEDGEYCGLPFSLVAS